MHDAWESLLASWYGREVRIYLAGGEKLQGTLLGARTGAVKISTEEGDVFVVLPPGALIDCESVPEEPFDA